MYLKANGPARAEDLFHESSEAPPLAYRGCESDNWCGAVLLNQGHHAPLLQNLVGVRDVHRFAEVVPLGVGRRT
jgi:hypothetical protein